MKVCGMDPSLRSWGLSKGTLFDGKLFIDQVGIIQPVLSQSKQVRQNSLDLESAYQLYLGALEFAKGADAVFVEVPIGSQSARAMAGYALCIGVLGALRATGVPFFEVTPTEVKLAATGSKTATKQQMIDWATTTHPEANWPYYKQQGQAIVSAAKAEHMADATAAIHAGLASNQFKQMLPFIRAA